MSRRRGALVSLLVGTLCLVVAVWWFTTRRPARTRPAVVTPVDAPDAAPRAGDTRPRTPPRPGAPDAAPGTAPDRPAEKRVIAGVVLRADRTPAADAVVIVGESIRTDEGAPRGDLEARAGADGRFRVEVDSDRAMAVIATHADGQSALELVEAGVEAADLVLQVEAPAAIQGRVLHQGEPAAGVRVSLTPTRSGLLTAFATSAADGSFTFARLVPGPYHVGANPMPPVARGAGGWTYVEVSLAAGETARVDVRLPDGVTLVAIPSAQLPGGDLTYVLRTAGGEDVKTLPMGPVRRPVAFPDVAPGAYRACAVVGEERCRDVTVTKTPPVQTVELGP